MIKLKKEGKYLMGYNENNKECCYYPLTKEAKELALPLLPNPFEDEKHIIKWIEKLQPNYDKSESYQHGFFDGLECVKNRIAAQSKQFSLEDMEEAYYQGRNDSTDNEHNFRSFIQSLSTQQLPSEFIPDYEDYELLGQRDDDGYPLWSKKLKTITNSEGKEEIQGRYVY